MPSPLASLIHAATQPLPFAQSGAGTAAACIPAERGGATHSWGRGWWPCHFTSPCHILFGLRFHGSFRITALQFHLNESQRPLKPFQPSSTEVNLQPSTLPTSQLTPSHTYTLSSRFCRALIECRLHRLNYLMLKCTESANTPNYLRPRFPSLAASYLRKSRSKCFQSRM